jgi:hypothetical protein
LLEALTLPSPAMRERVLVCAAVRSLPAGLG